MASKITPIAAPKNNALPDLIYRTERFDAKAMDERGAVLGMAGRGLNDAYGSSSAISGIANVLKRNLIGKDFDEGILSSAEEDQLLCALILLSEGLNDRLCVMAGGIEELMREAK